MSSDANTRELEWFDLETRMRELLYQQIEPIVNKSREDREAHSSLKIHCRSLEKRIKELETVVLGDKSADTAIMNIVNHCAEIDGNLKKEIVRLDQKIQALLQDIKNSEFNIKKIEESQQILMNTKQQTEASIESVRTLIQESKAVVLNEVEKLNVNFQDMNKAYLQVAIRSEEKSIEAFNKAHINSLEMGNYKREIDSLRKDIVDSLTMIREVRNYKLDANLFQQRNEATDKRFSEIDFELQLQKNDTLNRDAYIDRFIPLQTATMISDYLHFFTDLSSRKKIAEFENIKLNQLNRFALESMEVETRDERMAAILGDMKHIEERKVDLLTNESNQPKKRQPRPGGITFPPTFEEAPKGPPGLGKDEVELIVQKMISSRMEADFTKFRLDMQRLIEDINKNISVLSNETASMDRQLLLEMRENTERFEKSLKQVINENTELIKAYDTLKTEFKFSVHSMNNLGQMVVCLVENAQIQQALEAQDEEDRHNMAYNFEKELQSDTVLNQFKKSDHYTSTIPSGTFAFQKKCVSCGNANSILSGFRTSLLYRPTPLYYRNKKFERPELIGLKGRILKNSWESTAGNLPWKHETFEKILTEAAKVTLSTSVGETDRELPLLITPSSRAKSTNYRRFRFGSLPG